MGWRDAQAGALVRLPLGVSAVSRHLSEAGQEDLASIFREAVDAQRLSATAPLLLSGQRCDDEALRAWLGRAAGRDLATWSPPPLAEGLSAGPYAACIAAALRELGPASDHHPGISDELPLQQRVKQRVHTLPVVLSVLVVAGLLLHYAWLRYDRHRVTTELDDLKAQIATRQEALKANDELRGEQARLTREVRELRETRDFLAQDQPADRRLLAQVAADLAQLVPSGVALRTCDSLPTEGGRRRWRLEGGASEAVQVNAYIAALRGRPWCHRAELPRTVPAPAKPAEVRGGATPAPPVAPADVLPLRFDCVITLAVAEGS